MSRSELPTTAALLVALAIALTGCGGDDGETSTAPPAGDGATSTAAPVRDDETTTSAAAPDEVGDVCALLDGVDLDGLLGEPAGEPESATETCTVAAASADSRGGVSLVVSSQSAPENYGNRIELYGVDTEVSGLGEAAFHSGPYLVVLDGDTLVQLQVVRDASLGAGVDDALLESAVTEVLSNLG